jgi:quinoprotein glucose dehydrogenase
MESDLIDYTPAIKDSALKLAKRCRMGPYYIPASPADGKGKSGPAEYKCSWYAPGASGGVNIDGGSAADPETGMIYVGAQTGGSTIAVQKDPCSELEYTSPHNSCGKPGALPPPAGYTAPEAGPGGGGGGFARVAAPNQIGGISIFKPQQLGGITAYDLKTGDKKWWQPNGGIYRDAPTTTDPLFSGVTLPKIPFNTSQPELITTKTLLINGTGRSGGPGCATAGGGGGGGGRGGRGGGGGRGGAGLGPLPPPMLYAFDKATGQRVGAVSIPQVNSAVPMTFMHQGRQYIVFASGAGDCTKLIALSLPKQGPQ